jgi:signal transduction histidine kinase
VALLMVGAVSWFEFHRQIERVRSGGIAAVTDRDGPLEEALEIVLYAGLPSVLVGLIAGAFVMRRALRPIQSLTEALERTNVSNLGTPVPLSGSVDELDRMTVVFNRMKQRLDASIHQSREFTLHSSHELKTPLTILHGTMEQMLTNSRLEPADTARVESMLEEVQRLTGIVGQLSFLACADAGLLDFNLAPVAMNLLVEDLAEETSILASGRKINVRLTGCDPVTVNGDRMRLRQLFLNLADNAVKYNHDGGTVEIALHASPDSAIFTIINTGATLPPDLRARVFERFFRGDAAHGSEIEGSGLGLCIARTITELHRGTIKFDATDDGRTRVSVRVPAIQSFPKEKR